LYGSPLSQTLERGINAFALDLYAALREESGNLFFSPYNISVAMATAYGGARGTTAEQIATALKFRYREDRLHAAVASLEEDLQTLQSSGVQLITANSLWPQHGYPILDDFLSLLKEHYNSEIAAVDFQDNPEDAIRRINAWIKAKTKGLIPGLIEGLPPLTYFLIVAAIYFKGNWEHPFGKERTKQAPFHLTDGNSVMIDTMTQSERMIYGETDDLQILNLQYAENSMSIAGTVAKNDGRTRKT
jgi:serpin B